MKKLISLILLMLFLFINDGYYLFFKYLQNNIQHEIKCEIGNGIKGNELSLIIVHLNNDKNLLWIKKDKEFLFHGKMYDIVRSEIKNKKKYYYCINDVKEKQLIYNFVKNCKQKNKPLWNLKRIISNNYFAKKYLLKTTTDKLDFHFTEYKRSYKSRIIDVASPPPKFNFFS